MTHWIRTGLTGLACGIIARFLFPGSDSMSLILTMIVGIAGAYVGTAIGMQFGKLRPGQPAGWLWSIIGAMVILFALRLIS